MNRAFLIILVPAVLVAATFLSAVAYLGVRLRLAPFLGAGGGVLVVAGIVYLYRRRKVRPSGN
jgi:opacity protein-like surface antigen